MTMLSDEQQSIIRQCLVAIVEGPFLDDQDFQTRVGIERSEAIEIMGKDIVFNNESANLLINNCLNEVTHGIGFSAREWNKWFTASREQIDNIYSLWRDFANVNGGLM